VQWIENASCGLDAYRRRILSSSAANGVKKSPSLFHRYSMTNAAEFVPRRQFVCLRLSEPLLMPIVCGAHQPIPALFVYMIRFGTLECRLV